jgi:hypothetical protein
MDVTPTPQFTAWLYASVRAHPGWRLVFDSGGVDVKQVDPKAPDLLTVMHQFARDDPERMARFERELPDEWKKVDAPAKALILGQAA